ncbi:MAG TPA: beta-ketoacyl synthase N-terminal-like domain-containing protein, partial [Candidatus Acidoferrum sp.]|nr:beta-ketoacyl synthase N-terminal-like domain-containing protein [Candidatus Acidoferrum sp.]
MQARLDAQREPIAIIGMGCRFPGGAVDPESFWRLLENGVDAVTEIPKDRWPVDAYYDPDPTAPGKMYTRHAAFLDRVDGFDTEFFGIAPREAVSMDPQQRLLLEVAWEALENAACAPDKLAGTRTGVYLGISASDYAQRAMPSDSYDRLNPYSGTGCALSIAAGRLSYLLGLQGPSLALDTACSSSLVAVHLACQSLRVRECDVAIAGGVNLMLSPGPGIYLSKVRALAADGRCKTFDAEADGYVRGEGCGLVVLKRLSDAVTSRDRILAVIRGSAVNQDGRSGGLTAPNGPSQEAIVRQAMANAGVAPSEIGYIEAHGTGTPLGDPIELRALGAVLGKRDGVAIGSVKTNIGHLEAAAGIAGLIKTVLALQHRAIPPHLHFKSPNPHVPWSDLRFVVPTSCVSWDARRVAGVSSFGLSGTNAHVIVAEAPVPPQQAAAEDRPLHILTLSARSTTALRELIAAFIATSADNFADLCYTANTGRAHFPHRIATVAGSLDEARIALGSAVPREVRRKTPPTILFTFPDMPNTLAEQLAYAGTLRTWGIEPAYVTGEGAGELAAAVFAGAITVDEAETILKSGSQVARRAPQIGLVAAHNALPCDHTIRIERPSWPDLLALVADLYLAGAQIDWASFDRSYARRKLALPTYPFQRERYWLDTPVRRDGVDPPAAFPGRRIHSPALKDAVYESLLHRDAYPFVGDHQVYGAVVVAGACYVSMALSAGASVLHDVAFPEALVLEEGARHRLQLIVTPDRQFQVVSCLDSVSGNWRTHATGKLGDSGIAPAAPETLDT